jgi:putative endonuclease
MSTVYLLHFEKPIGNPASPHGQAQHYLGYAGNGLHRRLAEHLSGNGAKIVAAFLEQGIGFCLARTWPDGTRQLERKLKRCKDIPRRRCPVCRGEIPYQEYEERSK